MMTKCYIRIWMLLEYSMVLNASIMVDINDNVFKVKLLEVAHGPKRLMEINNLHEDSLEVESSEEEDSASNDSEEGETAGETEVPETNDVVVPLWCHFFYLPVLLGRTA